MDVSACDALVAADNNKNEKWGVAVNRLLYSALAQKIAPKTSFASKTGAAALALSLLAGNAWAAASCARPQDVTALRTAALQQQLMVAALTCHDVADYNRFVISYQSELQKSDKALMNFFLRQDARKGADDYNAYKTRLANASSLRSLRDPKFCRSAKLAFDVALNRKGRWRSWSRSGHLPSRPAMRAACRARPRPVLMADATPRLPARHQALPDSLPSAPIIASDLAMRPSPKPSFGSAQAGRVSDRRAAMSMTLALRGNRRRANPLSVTLTIAMPIQERPTIATPTSATISTAMEPRRATMPMPTTTRPVTPMTASARAYDRGDDGYSDNAGGNSGDRIGHDNGPAANNAGFYRDTDNVSMRTNRRHGRA